MSRIHTPRVVTEVHAHCAPERSWSFVPNAASPRDQHAAKSAKANVKTPKGKPTRDEHHRRGRGSCHSLERCACAICAPNPVFLARHAAARVPGASARPRSACEIAPRHCVRVACLVRSLENKHAGSQRQYGNNVVRGSAFESAVLEHRRLLPDQANTVPFVALGAHLLRCNPSNHTRPYALQSCISMASAQWTCVSVCLHSCMLLRGS